MSQILGCGSRQNIFSGGNTHRKLGTLVGHRAWFLGVWIILYAIWAAITVRKFGDFAFSCPDSL